MLFCNFNETKLRHGCSPVNLLHIFRTLLPKITSGGLFLQNQCKSNAMIIEINSNHENIKVGLSPSKKKIVLFWLIESPLKWWKMFFKNGLFVLTIFKFLSRFFGPCRKTGLTSQPGFQIIAIHILANISQSKGNQTMKFHQLIEHNKTNIFLHKLCRKWGKETSSRPLFIF